MSQSKLTKQQEMMKKFLEDKKSKNAHTDGKTLRPEKGVTQSTSKAKRSHNGGGFFDK